MTIAIALKVGDCVVLGADSASTLSRGSGVENVYFSAEKIMNLRKDLPIGMITYGLGSLAGRSITTHAKDLRRRLDTQGDALYLSPTSYTIKEVAERVETYFCNGLYLTDLAESGATPDEFPSMGFIVAGYGSGQSAGEVYTVEVDGHGHCEVQESLGLADHGFEFKGQPEVLYRITRGWSLGILNRLVQGGIPEAEAITFLDAGGFVPLHQPGMPMQDAIDLVRFMCEITAGFVRFSPGAPTVHPPIDLAAISSHEGFRWVQRKHYFNQELNRVSV